MFTESMDEPSKVKIGKLVGTEEDGFLPSGEPRPERPYEDEERAALAVGFTRDPDECAGEVLVADLWETTGSPYEVELEMDPDAYMFGVPRNWTCQVVALDPRYPVGKHRYEGEISWLQDRLNGTTTEEAERIAAGVAPGFRKRDRLIVRSEDGERELVFDYQKPVHRIIRVRAFRGDEGPLPEDEDQ